MIKESYEDRVHGVDTIVINDMGETFMQTDQSELQISTDAT